MIAGGVPEELRTAVEKIASRSLAEGKCWSCSVVPFGVVQ